MKRAATIAFVSMMLVSSAALGQQGNKTQLQLASECTTNSVSNSGRGHTCYADNPTCQTAPAGFVFAEKTVQANCTSCNGPLRNDIGRSCALSFADYVEIIPASDILQPTKVCVRASAESGSGIARRGVRGWSKCTVSGKMTKYTR